MKGCLTIICVDTEKGWPLEFARSFGWSSKTVKGKEGRNMERNPLDRLAMERV